MIADQLAILDEGLQAHEGQHVAGIQGEWYAVKQVQRGPATPLFAFVLDVIVNQQRVVQQLDRHRGEQRFFEAGAYRAGGRDAETGTHHLASALGIVSDQIVQVPPRLARGKIVTYRSAGELAVFAQHVRNQGRNHTINLAAT